MDIDDNGGGIRVVGSGFNGTEAYALNIDVDALIEGHNAKYNISTRPDGNKRTNSNVIANKAAEAQGTSFTKDGVTVTQVGTKIGDNSMYTFALDPSHFANIRLQNIEFKYPGSGAISGIQWSTDTETPQDIPEPSAIGGLLMIGYIGARRYRKGQFKGQRSLANS